MKKLLLTGTAGLLCAATALVGTSAVTAGAAGKGTLPSIYFANPMPDYPVFAQENACFKSETKKLNIKQATTAGPSGLALNDQETLSDISQAIALGYKAILMVPFGDQWVSLMKEAEAKGILVATLNTGNTTTAQDVELGTGYEQQGETIVDNLAKRPGQQNILNLATNAGSVDVPFVAGIKEAIVSHPNVHLITQAFDDADPTKTVGVLESALTANPTINVIVSVEGNVVQGIVQTIKQSNNVGKVVAVVNDITSESVAGMKGGEIYGISKQNFCGMGTQAVQDLARIYSGNKLKTKYVNTGITFVTKATLAANS